MYSYKFNDLLNVDIISGAIYEAGGGGSAFDPLTKLFKNPPFKSVGNQGGIRKAMKETKGNKSEAFVILLNTKNQTEWKNEYDLTSGILTYYGDNDSPQKDIHDTKAKGNLLLKKIFEMAKTDERYNIPPIFYFERTGARSDVKFIGLAVPHVNGLNVNELLERRTFETENGTYENYIAKFTIINKLYIYREWLNDLKLDKQLDSNLTPPEWLNFLVNGELSRTVLQYSNLDEDITGVRHTTSKIAEVRLTQNKFRQMLLDNQKYCQVCGIDIPEILVASHIKPWSVSDDSEKIDSANGLLLCANHDKLFDRNLISFNSDGEVILSKKMKGYKYENLNLVDGKSIVVTEEREKYLIYHRKMLRD